MQIVLHSSILFLLYRNKYSEMTSWKLKLSMGNSSNNVVKLIIPANPVNLDDVHHMACEKLNVQPDSFFLQYMDKDFNQFMNLTDVSEIENLMSLQLCCKGSETNSTEADSSASISEDLRVSAWPKLFEIPPFDAEIQLFLKSAEISYSMQGTAAVVPREIKGKILDTLANKIYSYTAYASNDQIQQVAKSLTDKYPSLRCRTTALGWEAWGHSISFKMGNFRSKLRKLGCEEVSLNGGKRSKISRPDAPPAAANIQKARKGELNFQPNLPVEESADSMEKYRLWMVDEMKKSNPDLTTLNRYMALTFAARRKEVGALALTSNMKDRWPALFTSSQVCIVIGN